MTIHSFSKQLAYSEEASCEPFWDAIYKQAFPNLVAHVPCPGDTKSQRMGIDRVLMLSNGKALYIDEKKRAKTWGDVLLEFISVDATGAPGWIEKDLSIDYLAYAFMDNQRVYLYPWQMLRRAWLHLGAEWKKTHKIITAQNDGYKTHCVAVPIPTLNAAVQRASIIQL